MKRKTKNAIKFIENLHSHLVKDPLLRQNVRNKSESQIQTELRPIILGYLVKYFRSQKILNPENVANKYFYWESQEDSYKNKKIESFSSRNYPDFIITHPYKIAIEYKKSETGSIVKQGIGQSVMHTLGGEFDFVYCLIHDESQEKNILNSSKNDKEKMMINKIWEDYNIWIKFL